MINGSNSFKYNSSYNVSAPNYYYPTVKTDDEIKDFAKGQTEDVYGTHIKNLENAKDYGVSLIEEAIKELEPLYENRINDLRDAYKYKGQQLGDYALSRGMGRSSHALDMQNKNYTELTNAEGSVQQEKMGQVNSLNRDILSLKMEYEHNKTNLTAQKDAEYRKMIYELEKERNDVLWEAQKYNDKLWGDYQDRIMSERKYQLDLQKYNLEVEKYQLSLLKYQQQLNAPTSSGGRSSSGRKSSGSGSVQVDHNRIASTWNGLNFSGKITYFEKNAGALKKASPNLYAQMNREYNQIKKSMNQGSSSVNIYNRL